MRRTATSVNRFGTRIVNKCINNIQSALFKPVCVLCGGHGFNDLDLCADCYAGLPKLETACIRCAVPLNHQVLCGQCLRKAPIFDRVRAPFYYASPLDQMIHRLKFQHKLNIARLLGQLMSDFLQKEAEQMPGQLPELLIPVPLHRQRLYQRGFNQSLEIGRVISRQLGIAMESRKVLRTRVTETQTSLDSSARQANVRAAFALHGQIKASRVAIIDDVITTGATANALAKVLRDSGVQYIEVWSCARAVLHGR